MTLSFSFSLFQNDVILGQTDDILATQVATVGAVSTSKYLLGTAYFCTFYLLYFSVANATGAGTIPTSKCLLKTAHFCTFYLLYLSVADATGASTVPTSK